MSLRQCHIEPLEPRAFLDASSVSGPISLNDAHPQRSMLRSLSVRFTHDVSRSLDAEDLKLWNLQAAAPIPITSQPAWNPQTLTAVWKLPPLPDGNYIAALSAMSLHDPLGNLLNG